MSASAWISLVTLVVGAIVTLHVAYMHRKQMRQIELYRQDPSVPLTPPPHRLAVFLKENWFLLWCLVFGTFDMVVLKKDLSSTAPLTRHAVFDIVMDMFGVGIMILFAILTPIIKRASKLTDRTLDVMHKMTHVVGAMSERSGQAPGDKDALEKAAPSRPSPPK